MKKAFLLSVALSFNFDVVKLIVYSSIFSPARLRGDCLGDAFFRDPLRIRALSRRRSREGAVEPVHIHLPLAALRFQGGMHRGQQLRP
jgi:hypothetical protein